MNWCARCKHLHKASNPRPCPCACHDPISVVDQHTPPHTGDSPRSTSAVVFPMWLEDASCVPTLGTTGHELSRRGM